MYSSADRTHALGLLASGATLSEASRATGIARSTLRAWGRPGTAPPSDCPRCTGAPLDAPSYAQLLGLYLGDGCLSALAKGVYSLRITCDSRYPGLIDAAEAAIAGVRAGRPVARVPAPGCTVVQSLWKHWVCLFPQHGAGRKHERPIVLAPWQRAIVDEHPQPLVRGLFHSDGCRVTNWTVRPLAAGPRRYEYPRYLFSNESADIIGVCAAALDRLGVHWTLPRRNLLSVARRADVALLDTFVGPKS